MGVPPPQERTCLFSAPFVLFMPSTNENVSACIEWAESSLPLTPVPLSQTQPEITPCHLSGCILIQSLTPETTSCKHFLESLPFILYLLCAKYCFRHWKVLPIWNSNYGWGSKQIAAMLFMSYSQCKGMKTWPLPWKTFNLVANKGVSKDLQHQKTQALLEAASLLKITEECYINIFEKKYKWSPNMKNFLSVPVSEKCKSKPQWGYYHAPVRMAIIKRK